MPRSNAEDTLPERMTAAEYRARPRLKRNKFGNRYTLVDGIRFDSALEARRYGDLKLLERAGDISGLSIQPRYRLTAEGGVDVGEYRGDFAYQEAGQAVCEDTKGVKTAVYKLKIKLARACHPHVDFREVEKA